VATIVPTSFRPAFDCLWCGTAVATRGPDDLEGWAQLCSACLGKAGDNAFLRGRLRSAIEARAAASAARPAQGATTPAPPAIATQPARRRAALPEPAPATFPDDWFLRRGAHARGAIHDTAWEAELDAVTRWLDDQPLVGRIEEPAAGVGFFSPLIAGKGELHVSDADGAALDRARNRLVAHRLLAHIHVADPWVVPPRPGEPGADGLLAAFMLGRVRGAGLDTAVASLHQRLRPGGRLASIELHPDPAGGPPDGIAWTWHDPGLVDAALRRAGFRGIERTDTGRFFVLASAEAG
jgi:SAM-dependent methyltransferase